MSEPFRTIRVLVVDDHTAVRAGLRTLLHCAAGIRVVAEAERAAEAVALCAGARPDVVLMDVRLAGGSGIEACRRIKADHPEVQVVMLSAYADEDTVVGAVIAGASGFLIKQSGSERLTEAVREAAAGGSSFDPRPARSLLSRFRTLSAGQAEVELQGLTDRERRILALIAEGCTNRAIGAALHLSEKTVRNLIGQLLQRFGFKGRAHAAAWAGERGLLEGGPPAGRSRGPEVTGANARGARR
jgi:two-component system response regulator DevR